jgi:hypothetical protein
MSQKNTKKFRHSKLYIFFFHWHFSGFYKGNWGINEKIYTDLKKLHKPGLQFCVFFQGHMSPWEGKCQYQATATQ